ncbi:MAG: carbohydrate ABC transporter permease [Actinobacteria bacterium]|nr:carbohydrate ABC transporter permease [Actinomycetota bacterium]
MSAEAQLDDLMPAGDLSVGTAGRSLESPPARGRPLRLGAKARAALGTAGRYLAALLACAAYLVPLLFVVNTSLKSQSQFLSSPTSPVSHPHWSNYLDAWRQAAFSTLVGNSLLYALVSATAATVLSLFLAFPVARGYVRGAEWWHRLFVISLFLPMAIMTQFQLILSLNLYDTRIGYILIMTSSFGIGPFLITSFLRSLPRELDQAAAIDGVGYFRYVLRVVLPLSKPVIITTFIFQLITVWNDIVNATIYLTDPSLLPVTKGLQNFVGQYSAQVPLQASAILIVALPLLLAYVFAQRFFVAGALGGAFKG